MPMSTNRRLLQSGLMLVLPAILLLVFSVHLTRQALAQEEDANNVFNNLLSNGNFEIGFYPVPELGFEPPDTGQVPIDWGWFKSQTFGKFTINNNEGFGIVCPEDASQGFFGRNALSFHIQSSDQPDARLGVYQTVNVVPGQNYLFAISGTIQVQLGGSSPDINHRVQLAFDHTGGTDWKAIPQNEWTNLPWSEQRLEFSLSGPDDPDLAKVEDYYTVVKARSDKLTIFIAGWRRWPNWRTSIFTFDCAALRPINEVDVGSFIPQFSEISTILVDDALKASTVAAQAGSASAAEPASVPADDTSAAVPQEEPAQIPDSGGILDTTGKSILYVIASVIVIAGLVVAGIWNTQRKSHR
jgi:hypothetical protein